MFLPMAKLTPFFFRGLCEQIYIFSLSLIFLYNIMMTSLTTVFYFVCRAVLGIACRNYVFCRPPNNLTDFCFVVSLTVLRLPAEAVFFFFLQPPPNDLTDESFNFQFSISPNSEILFDFNEGSEITVFIQRFAQKSPFPFRDLHRNHHFHPEICTKITVSSRDLQRNHRWNPMESFGIP